MGPMGGLIVVVGCAILVWLSNWWDNRKEEKERQHMITMNQDTAARQIMNDTFERRKKIWNRQKEHETCSWRY